MRVQFNLQNKMSVDIIKKKTCSYGSKPILIFQLSFYYLCVKIHKKWEWEEWGEGESKNKCEI